MSLGPKKTIYKMFGKRFFVMSGLNILNGKGTTFTRVPIKVRWSHCSDFRLPPFLHVTVKMACHVISICRSSVSGSILHIVIILYYSKVINDLKQRLY